ncbi:MAG: protein-L-isoaspartate O-methyltransferase family protein [Gammaproteobacteria bacterium]
MTERRQSGSYSSRAGSGLPESGGRSVNDYVCHLVEELKRIGSIKTDSIEQAFRNVERHRFVDGWFFPDDQGVYRTGRFCEVSQGRLDGGSLERIYGNQALVTKIENGWPASSASQPSLVAEMLELLHVRPGQKVLEVGTGTGFNAALLAEICGSRNRVVSVELDPAVAARARSSLNQAGYGDVIVIQRDGFFGAVEHGPFDRVIVTVGSNEIAPRWLAQLAADGLALVPLEHGGAHPLTLVRQAERGVLGRVCGLAGFMAGAGHMRCEGDRGRVRKRVSDGSRVGRVPFSLQPDEARDFWFYLGIVEPRTRLMYPQGLSLHPLLAPGYGLDGGPEGWAVIDDAEVCWIGTPDFARDLLSALDGWDALGRPKMGEFQISFVPKELSVTAELVVERAHHWEVFEL